MPIQRSKSPPNILENDQTPSVLPSHLFSKSSISAKGNNMWSEKDTNLITRKSHAQLTETTLKECNTNAMLAKKRYSTSPYYMGLTNYTLYNINKEKVKVTPSTRSSFFVKMQQMGSFSFLFKRKKAKGTPQKDKDSNKDGKEVKSSLEEGENTQILDNQKPLRERRVTSNESSTPLSPTPTPPPSILPLAEAQPTQIVETENKVTLEVKGGLGENEEKQKVFTWADKYRPFALTDFICNREAAMELQALSQSKDCYHFIFEGPAGVGKRTMIWALLRLAFGADRVQAREECKEFGLKGEAISSIQVNLKQSFQHVELNLPDLKGYEKHVIVQLIKDKNNKLSTDLLPCTYANCKAIILYQADKLSQDALLYIKWLLERYKGCNKVFFCCNDISKLEHIKPLCKVVKLLPPSNKEIVEVLEFVAKKEGIELPHQLAENIADKSKNNLRQAIRSFQATWRSNQCSSQLKEDQVIMTGWEDCIAKCAKDIVTEQSPRQLYNIRGELRKLEDHNVSPAYILKLLVEELKKLLHESLHISMDKLYKEYNWEDDSDYRFAFPSKRTEEKNKSLNDPARMNIHHFLRIEEFIAKFMSCCSKVWQQI